MRIKKSSIINTYDSVCVYCYDPAEHSCCGENHFAEGIGVEEYFRSRPYEQIYLLDEVDIIDDTKESPLGT